MLGPRSRLAPALLAAGGYAAAALAVRAAGFDAISDDDHARVVLAQAQAAAPRLDPTGSSWLPAPFWLQGAIMAAAGPSLAVARATAVALAAASGALLTRTGAALGLGPGASLLAALAPLAWPLVPLLGAAPVPELPVAAAVAAALGLLGAPSAPAGRWVAGGALLLAASLARYESWTPAAAFALGAAHRALRARAAGDRRQAAAFALGAALAAAGPPLWIIWNIHAHGDPLAFVRRVAAYRAGLGAVATGLGAYPAALGREFPVALAGGLLAAWRRPTLRAPVGAALLTVLALSAAEARGGAPTHHPERALLGPAFVLWLAAVAWATGERRSTSGGRRGAGDGPRAADDGPRAASGGRRAADGERAAGERPGSCERPADSEPPASGERTSARARLALAVALGAATVGAGAGRWGPTWRGLGAERRAEYALGRALAGALPPGERALLVADSYGFLAVEAALARPGALVARVPRSVDPRSPLVEDPLADAGALGRLRAGLPGVGWLVRRAGQAPWLPDGADDRPLPGGARLVRLP